MTDQIRAESGGDSLDLGHQQQRAVWTTAFINNLPDSSFLYIENGGDKDDEGRRRRGRCGTSRTRTPTARSTCHTSATPSHGFRSRACRPR